MPKKTLGQILMIIGAVAVIAALAADALGIGNGLGVGWKQILGAAVGVIILLVGVWLSRTRTS